ncbi:hypothetical protein OC842_001836 [Tilletia horrida]|uniref:GATA-type domain-containing protein n=1 Tax=Tilletia horrida TaxID=155126 RepID=A0AAN6GFK5_9BASI|nr:hypothetical protein OC842_001836 [Tilletia horrida]
MLPDQEAPASSFLTSFSAGLALPLVPLPSDSASAPREPPPPTPTSQPLPQVEEPVQEPESAAARPSAPSPAPSHSIHSGGDLFGPSSSNNAVDVPPPEEPAPAPAGSVDLEQDGGPSLISEATDAIRLLQDASEREHVLLAFRKAATEAQSRARALEDEAREATKRAVEARSAANHLVSIIHQIEKGPGAPTQPQAGAENSNVPATEHSSSRNDTTFFAPQTQPFPNAEGQALFAPTEPQIGDGSDVDNWLNLNSNNFPGTAANGGKAPSTSNESGGDAPSSSNPTLRPSSSSAATANPPVSAGTSSNTQIANPSTSGGGTGTDTGTGASTSTRSNTSTTTEPAATPPIRAQPQIASSDARKRPRPSATALDTRRCDDCGTADTVLWRHIENEVFCNACALRRRRATKRAHLEAKRVTGAVSASAPGAGFES